MQPDSNVKFNKDSFDIIKRTIKNISIANKGRNREPHFATTIPSIVGLKLTNRCNLRCKHCYEWNEDGYHRNMSELKQRDELDFQIVEKIMNETREANSNLYLWGGEPTYYSEFDKLMALIEQDRRITAICTNGILIDSKMDSILRLESSLELLIALEGFEQENDEIRGQGTFNKVVNNIDLLLDLRKKGIFKGKISIHTVISDKMVGKLYDFVDYFEKKGIDSLYLCFPWYISCESSTEMDQYFEDKFNWIGKCDEFEKHSWHAFKYRLDPKHIGTLMEELTRINQRVWNLKVRYQPNLKFEEISDFIYGKHLPAQNRTRCLSISMRMDVLPNGSISSCKHFPEFMVGNLEKQSVDEVWNCAKFKKIRETINGELMPVCSKCNNLYLHGN